MTGFPENRGAGGQLMNLRLLLYGVRRALMVSLTLGAAAMSAACATEHDEPSPPPSPTVSAAPATPTWAGAVPAALVGAWESAQPGSNTTLAYRFTADGRYAYAGVLTSSVRGVERVLPPEAQHRRSRRGRRSDTDPASLVRHDDEKGSRAPRRRLHRPAGFTDAPAIRLVAGRRRVHPHQRRRPPLRLPAGRLVTTPTPPTPRTRFSVRIRVQIGLILVVSLATLVCTWQFSQAGGAYQDAVREDVKRQAAVQEDVRHLYADEAPPAFLVAAEEARAEALSALGKDNRVAVSEHALASRTAFSLRQAAPPEILVGNDTYLTRNLGYDVPRRLADVQEHSPEMYALNPDATLREGDRWASWGWSRQGSRVPR